MNETDAVGYPIRKVGDKIVVNGEEAIVVENLGNPVLCPCPDWLKVKIVDRGVILEIENAEFETWK